MSMQLRIGLIALGWVVAVTFVHLELNTRALDSCAAANGAEAERFRVGFLPVT